MKSQNPKLHYSIFYDSVLDLLSSNSIASEIKAIQGLLSIYDTILEITELKDSFDDFDSNSTIGGIALSSQHAFDCLNDPIRTSRFIKGMYKAIQDSILENPNKSISVLYAGCGPIATLVLPLLCMFKDQQISITLIDINSTSIASVRHIVSKLQATEYINSIDIADATQYRAEGLDKFHVILTETMDRALTREPQVSITQNLIPLLKQNGKLIPECINVYAEHTSFSKELNFNKSKNVFNTSMSMASLDKHLLFKVDKTIYETPHFKFISQPILVPNAFNDKPDVCVFAELIIYNDVVLEKTNSYITNSYCVFALNNLNCKTYTLHYSATQPPHWKLISNTT